MSDVISPYKVLRTGMAPPPVLAFCQLCDMPAYRQCMDIVTSGADYIGIHCQCCGKTMSSRIPWKEFLRLRSTGEKWYGITRKGSAVGVRGMARSNFAGMHGK